MADVGGGLKCPLGQNADVLWEWECDVGTDEPADVATDEAGGGTDEPLVPELVGELLGDLRFFTLLHSALYLSQRYLLKFFVRACMLPCCYWLEVLGVCRVGTLVRFWTGGGFMQTFSL